MVRPRLFGRAFASSFVTLLVLVGVPSASSLDLAGVRGLRVEGNGLVDSGGLPFRLLGVNRSGSEYMCIQDRGFFEGPSDDASVKAIRRWGANAVRVPMNEGCWLAINGAPPTYSGAAYQQAIRDYVDLLIANELVPILELHWSAAGTGIADGQEPMPNRDHTIDFWTQVADAYKDDASVILDLFNEPYPDNNQDTEEAWTCWRDGGTCVGVDFQAAGMQELVDAVRGTGATNVIMLSGVRFANALSGWLAHQPVDPLNNLVAAWHAYNFNICTTVACWEGEILPVHQQVPVIATEIGENECEAGFINPLMAWLDDHDIGYLPWAWDVPFDCFSLITDYQGTATAVYGRAFRDHLAAMVGVAGHTSRLSVSGPGVGGNRGSSNTVASLSADGRYVSFTSAAGNLVPNDTNGGTDVFVYDRITGTTERVSVSSSGTQATLGGHIEAISGNGRFVAFASGSPDLVPGDTNGQRDVFVHDLESGLTERVSVDGTGQQGNSDSFWPVLSGDGRYVAFLSSASNLVPNDTNEVYDVFVRDGQTGTIERVSVDGSGGQANFGSGVPSISADGRYVAFATESPLVTEDANGVPDIFVRDRALGSTERVSVSSSGGESDYHSQDPVISSDGLHVAFRSDATNLVVGDINFQVDVFIHDMDTGLTELVSVDTSGAQGNFGSIAPAVSSDGRYVAFTSFATNWVRGDSNEAGDIFVRDRQSASTELVSVDSVGVIGNGDSEVQAISGDGQLVAFTSQAPNLAPGDNNNDQSGENIDVFVHQRGSGSEAVSDSAEAGATVTTDSLGAGATASDPVEVSVTTPAAGAVTISEGPVMEVPPAGFVFLGRQIEISAPDGTAASPLMIQFDIDYSQIPAGDDETSVQVFRNGVEVLSCTGDPGTASPDPCVSQRISMAGGDVRLTVLTSSASTWNLAAEVSADLALTKTDPPGRAPMGRNMTYTLTVTNAGPDAASQVTVTDQLPASMTFVSVSTSRGTCEELNGMVSCALGTLLGQAEVAISIVVRPTQAGTITNTASVASPTRDANLGNNADSESTSVCRITSRRSSIPCG